MLADQEPILFEVGSAIETKKKLSPWMKERIYPFVGSMRGSFPEPVVYENAKKFSQMITSRLKEFGAANEPLGLDITEMPFLRALEAEGIRVVDGQQTILKAETIKTPEEIELIETAIAIAEAAFWEVLLNIA